MKDRTIFDLIEERIAEETRLLGETFDLGAYAGQIVTQEKYGDLEESLGRGQARVARAAEMQRVASEYRDKLLAEALEINQDFDRAKIARQEALEAAIDPDVTTEAKLQAVMASSEQLIAMAELSLATGDDDGVLLVLRVARQDADKFETVEQRIRAARPDLDGICSELDTIEELPDASEEEIEDRLESVAQGAPNREQLLREIS